MLANRRGEISTSGFTYLDALGKAKLDSINQQEIAYLRKRVEAERIAAWQMRKSKEQAVVGSDRPRSKTKERATRVKTIPSRSIAVRSDRRGLGTRLRRVEYEDTSLAEVLEDLRDRSGVNIVANWQSLADMGIDKTEPISLELHNASAGTVLKLMLSNLSARWGRVSYVVQDGVVVIASAADLAKIIDTRVYDVSHMMMETKDKRGGGQFEPGGSDKRGGGGGNNRDRSSNRSSSRNSRRSGSSDTEELRSEKVDKIIAMVRDIVPAESWRENGGPGSLTVFGTRLVVTQTAENHTRIGKTLFMIGW